ncbi:DUF5063 domain-containing protein (plasmid) [Planococcus glaciei]|uniref:DUF5063 domain-containing protein n=1 Tax=Planococcus glaciei TaxID=459472 RepID=A0A7H8QFU1_9BACL|nr:DUF5063 domain-containing protein [Planococcus glaciei]QKX52854.1 DUF5063 domain-containing protein [Planococcus glaciei]
MRSKEVRAFVTTATTYCDFIDSHISFEEKENLSKLLKSLSQLYAKALELPEVEPKEEHSIDLKFPLPKVEFKSYNVYLEIFNPYCDTTPVKGCLEDDITDIYSEIKKGLILYEHGHELEAVWHWKFGLKMHWGEHATSAIRALQSIKSC